MSQPASKSCRPLYCAFQLQHQQLLLLVLFSLVVLASAFAPPAGPSPSSAHHCSSSRMTRIMVAGGQQAPSQQQQQARPGEIDVILCRHGQTDFNAENRCQGTSDVSRLTAEGQAQAAALGRAIAAEDRAIHRVFLSPLARARHTYDGMEREWRAMRWGWEKEGAAVGAPATYPTCAPTFLPDLQEIHLYSWQGHLREDLKAKHPDAFHNWYHDPDAFSVDGGYPVRELWARAKSAWATILAQSRPGERVLVVAHSGINQALCLAALGHGPGMYRRLNFVNCGAIHLRVRLPASAEHAHKLAHRGGYTLPMAAPASSAGNGQEAAGGDGNSGGAQAPQQQRHHHYRVVHPPEWEPEMHAPAAAAVEEAEMAGKR